MTFKNVVMKNFIGNLRKYLSYFLSGVFCVAMFFTYSTLATIKEVTSSVETYPMDALMVVTCVIISIFSIIFINYSHSNFVTNKKKELATYMVLGMDSKDCTGLLLAETSMIAGTSIVVGLVVGMIASRIFGLIVKKIVEIDDISNDIHPNSFGVTVVVFILIYAVCFIVSIHKMKKKDLSSIIRDKRMVESKPFGVKNIILSVAGFVLLAFSIVFVLKFASDSTINYKMWFILTFIVSGFAGTFMIAANLVTCAIAITKRGKKCYNKMLATAGISFKFKQNMKIIIVLTMLASMIVLLVGSPVALISISKSIAEDSSADIEYVLFSDNDKVSSVISGVESEEITEFRCVRGKDEQMIPVFSCAGYNSKYGGQLQVAEGKMRIVNTGWMPGSNGYDVGSALELGLGSGIKSFEIEAIDKGEFDCGNLFKGSAVYVINDDDYRMIEEDTIKADVHKIMLDSDWLDREEDVDKLTETVGNDGFVNSRMYQYNMLRHGYSVFLFVSCSMCFMFFISTGFVLYFKQYNEIDEDRQQFVQLYKMGISEKEISKSIRKKMAVVYFLPLLGCIMGIAIMYYMTSLFGGGDITGKFMSKSGIGLGLYSFSQVCFYLFLEKKYTKDVSNIQ